jgi:outer membrane protein TolC
VSWPLPLGRAGRERAAAARASAAAAEAAAEASLLQLERRARAATAAADNASRILAEAEPTMERLASAEHSLAEQFRLGAISYLVYIDGLSRLDEVRTQAITARRELLAARLELARVLGDSSIFPLPEVEP